MGQQAYTLAPLAGAFKGGCLAPFLGGRPAKSSSEEKVADDSSSSSSEEDSSASTATQRS